jgi:hypothetical protein
MEHLYAGFFFSAPGQPKNCASFIFPGYRNGANPMWLLKERKCQRQIRNYLLAFDGVIASRGGIPLIENGAIIGAIGVSGGTDSQDEIVSQAGAATMNQSTTKND